MKTLFMFKTLKSEKYHCYCISDGIKRSEFCFPMENEYEKVFDGLKDDFNMLYCEAYHIGIAKRDEAMQLLYSSETIIEYCKTLFI